MDALRVLQFGMTPNPGGIESFIMNYYRNIDRSKIQFDFVNMYGEIAYQDEIVSLGGNVYDIAFFKKYPIKNYYALKKLIKENKYNVVHVNMLSAAYDVPLIAAKKNNVNCIIAHSHNSLTPPGKLRRYMDSLNKSRMLKNATHYFACSEQAGNWMFSEKNENKPIHIINNAIDTAKFRYNSEQRNLIRTQFDLNSKLVFGHVGRFHYQKNHDFLIDIFYQIYTKNSNAVLLLVGDGELSEEIKSKVIRLGIEKAVKFLGLRSDIESLMQAMDVFLFPSLYEGLGMVLVEAQASGLRCFTSNKVVPNTVNITGLVEFIDLDKSAEEWAELVLESLVEYERKDFSDVVSDNGYDVKKTCKWLEQFYLDHVGN